MMKVGDTIQCHDIEDMLEYHEALCKEGWDVEFVYKRNGEKFLLLKGRKNDEDNT